MLKRLTACFPFVKVLELKMHTSAGRNLKYKTNSNPSALDSIHT